MPEVELLEVFGSDLTVVNAARVSMGKESTAMTPGDALLNIHQNLDQNQVHTHLNEFSHSSQANNALAAHTDNTHQSLA